MTKYDTVLQDICYEGGFGGSRGAGGASGQKKKVVISDGNTSEQIIAKHLRTIDQLTLRVQTLEQELEEARRPTKKYYCKVKE